MHVIRLRRPWNKSGDAGVMPETVEVPEADVDNPLPDERTYHYRRSFNLPTGLQESSRVYLRIDGWQGRLESADVNGISLEIGDSKIVEDITNCLRSQNQITLCLSGLKGQPARLSGEVTLAIAEDHQ